MIWPNKKLADVAAESRGTIQTGPFGSQLHQCDYAENGIPVVMPKDIIGGRINLDGIAKVPNQKAKQLSRHILHAGDIVFPRRGEINKCALVSTAENGFLCGTGCLKISIPEVILDSHFLFFFLTLPSSSAWLEKHAVGSTMLNLNTQIVGDFEIPLPPLPEQRRIVGILSAYDDLIENNRKRIALLEESARQLYREWFARFRFPGHERTPFVHGVPKGWKRCRLVDMIDINPVEPRPKTDAIRYVPMSALATTDMVVDLSETELRTASTPVRFRNGDTLLARITPCLENGKTGFVYFLSQGEVACGSTEFIVLRGRTVSPAFVYCLARTDDFRETAIKSMIGSSGRQRVQPACLAEYPMVQPPQPLLDRFGDFALPLFKQIAVLCRESEKLSAARDALLPRLMKGGAA